MAGSDPRKECSCGSIRGSRGCARTAVGAQLEGAAGGQAAPGLEDVHEDTDGSLNQNSKVCGEHTDCVAEGGREYLTCNIARHVALLVELL